LALAKLFLGGGTKREPYLMDGSMDLNLSSPPKKGRLFGKSCASDCQTYPRE